MKNTRTRGILCIVLAIIMVIGLSGCTSFDNFKHAFIDKQIADDSTIYIGVLEPKTGAYSAKGIAEVKGIELANSIYSNVRGMRVKLIYMDTNSDVPTTEAAIEDMVELKPIAIIGATGEATSMAISNYIKEAKIPTITPSAINPLITQDNDYYFRTSITEIQKGAGLANYAYDGLKSRRIGIVSVKNNSQTDAIIEGFTDELEKYTDNSPIVLNTKISIDDTDYLPLINKILMDEPNVIFMPVGPERADAIFTEIEKAGLTDITFLGDQSWGSAEFVKMMKKHPDIKVAFPMANVTLAEGSTKDTVTAETQRFLIEYSRKYGTNDTPTDNAALGYDSYLLIMNAINNAKEITPQDVRDSLASLENVRGATGVFSFDKTGSSIRKVNISTIKDGEVISTYVTSESAEARMMKKISRD